MTIVGLIALAGIFTLLRRWARHDVFTAPPNRSTFR